MKLLQYIRYFFLSISNRGFLFTIKLLLLEPYYERQLGIQTLAIENLEGMNVLDTDFQINHHYQGASYYVLHQVFEAMNQQVHHHSILDYGCGKGRPMIVAAREGFTNVNAFISLSLTSTLSCLINKTGTYHINAFVYPYNFFFMW